jgi:hypothetical protein
MKDVTLIESWGMPVPDGAPLIKPFTWINIVAAIASVLVATAIIVFAIPFQQWSFLVGFVMFSYLGATSYYANKHRNRSA